MNTLLKKLIEIMENVYKENNRLLDRFNKNIPIKKSIDLCELLKTDMNNVIDFKEKIDFAFLEESIGSLLFKRLNFNLEFINVKSRFKTTQEQLNPLLDEIIEILKSRLNNHNDFDYNELNDYNNRLYEVISLIKENQSISKSDFKFIVDFIRNLKHYNENEKKEILLELGAYLLNSNDYSYEEVVLIEKNEISLPLDKLKQIFGDYGYEELLDIALDKHQKELNKLIDFGKINNIEQIFECFKKLNIDSNYLKERVGQLLEILLRSNSKNVNTIIEIIRDDIENDNVVLEGKVIGSLNEKINDLLVNYYMKTPTIFVESNQKLNYNHRDTLNKKTDLSSKDIFSGTMRNFIENRKTLFQIKGFKLKLDSFSNLQIPFPKLFNYNLSVLYKYGLTENHWKNALSCFRAPDIEAKFDLCIELGLYDYVKENPSFLFTMKPLTPYRVKYYNVNPDSLDNIQIIGKRHGLKLEVTNPHKVWDEKSKGPEGKDIPYTDDQMQMISAYQKKLGIINNPKIDLPFNVNIKESIFDIKLNSNEYKFRKAKLINQDLKKLFDDVFKVDDLTYQFNGIIISRQKVLRNLRAVLEPFLKTTADLPEVIFYELDRIILYCVTRNSILTEEEYIIIKNCINERENVLYDGMGVR